MKKIKYFLLLLLTFISISFIPSCGNNDSSVTFKLLNDSDNWVTYKSERCVNGKVNLPITPTKPYFNFNDWYLDEDFNERFINENIKSNIEVYGRYIDQEVKVYIDDEEPVIKKLVDVANATIEPVDGLSFDGWYIDASYNIKWNKVDNVSELYGKKVAIATFNNGYEDIYLQLVKPGEKILDPQENFIYKDGIKVSLEQDKIVKSYMSCNNIHYFNKNNEKFNFNEPIYKNTDIKVTWNSKGIGKGVYKNKDNDSYYLILEEIDPSFNEFPAFSIQEEVRNENLNIETIKDVKIEGVIAHNKNWIPKNAKKLIFNEGIKYIKNLNASRASKIEEIVLPQSLRIIDNSFNGFGNLKSVNLNDGIEIIISSFFKNKYYGDFKSNSLGDEYGFEIHVPSSIKNLSMIPSNLKFEKDSSFYKEDGRIYKSESNKKILISDSKNVKNSSIIVPEGVQGIQVGTYFTTFDYLYLPSTFEFVNYNEPIENYPYYPFYGVHSFLVESSNLLIKDYLNEPSIVMNSSAYSITSSVGGYNSMGAGVIIFQNDEIINSINPYSFVGDISGWALETNGYSSMLDPILKKYVYTPSNNSKCFTLRIDLDEQDSYGNITFKSFSAILDLKEINVDIIIDAIKEQNIDNIEEIEQALSGKTLKFYELNKLISTNSLSDKKFVTIKLV